MRAALVYGMGDLRLEDIPVPEVPRGSIRVKVESCAICGTDLRIYRKGDYRAAYPVVVGHEIAGIVEAVDRGIEGVKVGDRVCVAPGHGCGQCRACLSGYPNVCTQPYPSLGYKVNGGFQQIMAVPENIFRLGFVNPIPEGLGFDEACLSEIIACCLNAQKNAPVHEGDTVLILGSGPAGIVHSRLSQLRGAAKVILAQRTRSRLEMAQKLFPVDRTVVMSEENLAAILAEETDGRGADVVFVCAPSREAQETATRLVAPRGRVNFFGGLPKDDHIISVDANALHYKEFFISGASSSLPEDNREALRLLAAGKIDPDRMITHRFGLGDLARGFDVVERREGIKVVIHPAR